MNGKMKWVVRRGRGEKMIVGIGWIGDRAAY